MNISKDKNKQDKDLTIPPIDGNHWSNEEKKMFDAQVSDLNKQRTSDRLIRNKMLSVLYRLEEYLLDNDANNDDIYTVEFFVIGFCNVLDLNKTEFANYLDMDVSNLNKYLKGQRSFSKELAMKLSHFFHTPVDVWLKLQLKNDLIALQKDENQEGKYEKYDYRKVVKTA